MHFNFIILILCLFYNSNLILIVCEISWACIKTTFNFNINHVDNNVRQDMQFNEQ